VEVLFVWTAVYEWVRLNLYQEKSSKKNIFQIRLILGFYILLGCVMAQLVSHHPPSTETWAQSQSSVCGICGGKSDTGTSFTASTWVFSCQCCSSIAPYSFIMYHQ